MSHLLPYLALVAGVLLVVWLVGLVVIDRHVRSRPGSGAAGSRGWGRPRITRPGGDDRPGSPSVGR